jgi:hypothetical protein
VSRKKIRTDVGGIVVIGFLVVGSLVGSVVLRVVVFAVVVFTVVGCPGKVGTFVGMSRVVGG